MISLRVETQRLFLFFDREMTKRNVMTSSSSSSSSSPYTTITDKCISKHTVLKLSEIYTPPTTETSPQRIRYPRAPPKPRPKRETGKTRVMYIRCGPKRSQGDSIDVSTERLSEEIERMMEANSSSYHCTTLGESPDGRQLTIYWADCEGACHPNETLNAIIGGGGASPTFFGDVIVSVKSTRSGRSLHFRRSDWKDILTLLPNRSSLFARLE